MKHQLGLSDGALGLVLLGAAIGSLLAIPIAGRLISQYGAKSVALWSCISFCCALSLPALALGPLSLFLALFVFGAVGGTNGVAMNAQAVAIENLLERPVMSSFHAMFSLGGICGAIIGGLAISLGASSRMHLGMAGAVLLAATIALSPLHLETRGLEKKHPRLPLRDIPRALLLLCVLGFCIFLSEGAIADWTAVYLSQTLRAAPGLAAAGYAVFSCAMTIFRLLGDRITVLLGRNRTIRFGAWTAAAGIACLIAAPTAGFALPGLALAGMGYSAIIPLVFAAAGRIPKISAASGIATVTGLGYIAFLIGPPMIGAVAQFTSLRVGLGLLLPLALLAALLPFQAEFSPANPIPKSH